MKLLQSSVFCCIFRSTFRALRRDSTYFSLTISFRFRCRRIKAKTTPAACCCWGRAAWAFPWQRGRYFMNAGARVRRRRARQSRASVAESSPLRPTRLINTNAAHTQSRAEPAEEGDGTGWWDGQPALHPCLISALADVACQLYALLQSLPPRIS